MREVFETLADRAEDAWRACDYDPKAFADIAARAIQESDLRSNLDPDALLRWALTAAYPDQLGDNEYGEPAITFVRRGGGAGFRVEVIFWMDGMANVHGHAAEGAFYLLDGERLHATYDFDTQDTSTPGVVLGDLRLNGVELLVPGDLRKIYPGFRSIHSLCFIGRPCITVSVRSVGGDAPFYLYANPVVLMDLAVSRASKNRRVSAFEFFVRLHPSERLRMGREVLESADVDILTAQAILVALRPTISEQANESLMAVARERFGGWIDRVLDASEDRHRRRSIETLFPDVETRGPRIMLGLVWAGADRGMTLELLARAFPGEDPLALVDRWTLEIVGPRTRVERLSAALGIAPEDDVSALIRQFRQRISRA